MSVHITRVEHDDDGEDQTWKVTAVRLPDYMTAGEPDAEDLPPDVLEAVIRWAGTGLIRKGLPLPGVPVPMQKRNEAEQ